MKYLYLKDRSQLHEDLNSLDLESQIDTCCLCERDELNRIVGAFVILNHDTYLSHLDSIDRKIVRRNDLIRKNADVPEFDKVKNLRLTIDRKEYNLYHRTHLVPFRFCLNDGSLRNLLFTATA